MRSIWLGRCQTFGDVCVASAKESSIAAALAITINFTMHRKAIVGLWRFRTVLKRFIFLLGAL
jgi:hypothetical protein